MYKIKLSQYHKNIFYESALNKNNKYNIVFDQTLENNLDIKRLTNALYRLISDYVILNSHILKIDNELYWVKNSHVQLLEVMANYCTRQKISNFISKPFNLENEPLYRFTIFKNKYGNYRLILVFHQIIIDNSDFNKLSDEISNYYNLSNYKIKSYLSEQKKSLISTSNMINEQAATNQNKLLDVKKLDLTFLKKNLNILNNMDFNIKELPFNFSEKITDQIIEFVRKRLITVSTYSRDIFAILLYRYTNSTKFVIGNQITTKNESDIVCGFQTAINLNVFEFDNYTTLANLFKQDKDIEANHNYYLTNNSIIEPNHYLLDIMFTETNLFQNPKFGFFNVKTLKVNNKLNMNMAQQILFEIELNERTLNFRIKYNSMEIDKTLLQNFVYHYKKLFINILSDLTKDQTNKLISRYQILTPNGYQKIVYDWNNTNKTYPQQKTVHQLFEEQVLKTPENIAIIYNDLTLTYKKLNQKANQLANYIKTIYPINSDDLIALCFDRSEHMLVAILAVLKSGAAYVPIDTNYPDMRINYILEDSKTNILLTDQSNIQRLSELEQCQLFAIHVIAIDTDNLSENLQKQASTNLKTKTNHNNLAYVIYTSGTTGKPKGVMVEHQSVVNLVFEMINKHDLSANCHVALHSNFVFDASVYELFPALSSGSRIFLIPEIMRYDVKLLSNYYITNDIRVSFIPTVLLNEFLAEYTGHSLKLVYVGGEKLVLDYSRYKNNSSLKVVNEYGLTEATVCTTQYEISKHSKNNWYMNLIGKPIANTKCYVLDNALQIVPIGVIGELHIGGIGIARGYLNLPELTKTRFITNHFQTIEEKITGKNRLLYKTGDLVRWLPNGNLEYLGRNDSQVKIRGYRIELGEIENKLCQHKKIKQAIVYPQKIKNNLINNENLIAYYILDEKYSYHELNNYLKSWVDLYDNLYADLGLGDYKYNTLGWNSSYTSKPIPKDEITEFVDNTVTRIISLKPKNILEIGCGSGLILFNVLNICNKYIASDFSAASIEYINKVINTKKLENSKVSTICCNAHELERIDFEDEIDTVIINSVTQYFPNIDYLTKIVGLSVSKIKTCGKIFIGDVRDFRLLKLFYFSILSYQNISLNSELIDEYSMQDTELLVSPQFFIYCKKLFKQIRHVDILPKIGSYDNEMNCFRYDVVLYINNNVKFDNVPQISPVYTDNINLVLENTNDKEVIISYINKRIYKDYIGFNKISGKPTKLSSLMPLSIDEIYSLANSYGYNLKVLLDVENPIFLNLIFFKNQYDYYHTDCITLIQNFNLVDMTNNPMQKIELSDNVLTQSLEKYLSTQLPAYMIPKHYIKISKIPLTANGKIDYIALPKVRFNSKNTYISPKNDIESKMVTIWSDVLGIAKEQIGTNDNFFKLGGNSLLVVRLKNRLTMLLDKFKEITVADLFKYTTVQQLTDFIMNSDKSASKIRLFTNVNTKLVDIAIIGISGAFSGGANLEDYWEKINHGKSGLTRHSFTELKDSGISEELLNHKDFVPVTGKILDTNEFDGTFWSMSPQEIYKLDPQVRKFLEHSWYVLESSGYLIDRSVLNIGVFAGGRNSPYINNNKSQFITQILGRYGAAGELNTQSSLAMQVSYLLGLTGISSNINTACSTSLVAIIEACKNITAGYCDMAIAGGVSLILPSEYGYLYHDGGIFSKDGASRIFDNKSSGMVSGSGVGVVLLKSLEKAIEDKDNILAIIKGYNINNDGARKMTYTSPSVIGQVECIINAQKMAGISFDEIDYIECHGTGTSLGDAIEAQALNEAFAYNMNNTTIRDKKKCYIGSVKANIGHAEIASGVAGFIKICKMFEHNVIPRQINFDILNQHITFEGTPFTIPKYNQSWIKNGEKPRYAAVSSFGIGGTNAHLIISDYILKQEVKNNTSIILDDTLEFTKNYLLPLSAKSQLSLLKYKSYFVEYLKNSKYSLSDIAYTLQLKREKYQYRTSIVADSVHEAIEKFENYNITTNVAVKNEIQNIVFMFPGQGAQYANMTLNLYQNNNKYKSILDSCLLIINHLLGISFEKILFPKDRNDFNLINETQFAQLALFSVSYSLAKWLEELEIKPSAYLGHSIGEIVAATLSGVFNIHDAIKLVIDRGKLMQSMQPGSMLLIHSYTEELDNTIYENNCEITVINSPQQIVVSGTIENISKLKNLLDKKQVTSILLKVSHGYHSYLMENASKKFISSFKDIKLHHPNKLFISNITGEFIIPKSAVSPEYWSKHIRHKVLFKDGIITISKHFQNPFYIQVGPGQELLTFVNQTSTKAVNSVALIDKTLDISNKSEFIHENEILNKLWLHGYDLNFGKYWDNNKFYTIVNLPNYYFNTKTYEFNGSYFETNKVLISQDIKTDVVNRVQETDLPDQYYDIAKIFLELLNISIISIHDSFFDLGGNSISALTLITKLKNIGINLTLVDIVVTNSVAKIYNFANHYNTKLKNKTVVPLLISNQNKKVFFIHPIGGTVIQYLQIIQQLKKQYDYYGIQNINILSVNATKANNFEELCSIYLKQILAIQESGDYIFMGSSIGGNIAYEISRQLAKLGKTTKYIVMFDSWANYFNNSSDSNEKTLTLEDFNYLNQDVIRNSALSQTYNNLISAGNSLLNLISKYKPQKNDVKIYLFKATETSTKHINMPNSINNFWQKYTNIPMTIYNIYGNHNSILSGQGLSEIVKLINSIL